MDSESAWAIKPGAIDWADEVEAEEVKKGPMVDETAFPTLGEAVKTDKGKSKGGKKSKAVKMSLNDFFSAPVGRKTAVSDAEILMQLPKGSSGLPREERDPNALGGAFRDYGGDRQGGFRRGDRGDREEREPSRADAVSDWGAERKFTPSDPSDRSRGFGGGGGGFGERRGGFGDRDREGGFGDRPRREDRPVSEADTVDDWGSSRKFVPSGGSDSRSFGSGFGRDGGERPRRAGFPDSGEPSRADTGDWGSRRGPAPAEPAGAGSSGRRGYGFSDQPVSQADMEDRWSHRAAAAEPSGRPAEQPTAERPRLKLAPRTKPVETPANGVAPSSPGAAAVSPTSSGQQQAPVRKSNPFGAAKPREEVLKEKGIDYRKEEMKLDHGEVIRDKTPEETDMEKEVEELRVKLEGLKELTPGETDTLKEVEQELDEKEKALYRLQAELDDKVRFSKNRTERERSADPTAHSAADDDGAGFQEVRNPRKERAGGSPGQAAEGREAAGSRGDNAWGSGRGFRDRDNREEGRGGRGGSSRDRENRDGLRGGGFDRDREGRDRRPAGGAPGRTAGGW